MELTATKGLISLPSLHSFNQTVERFIDLLKEKNITLFGTPLMLEQPTTAIDLPLKILVWQDSEAKVWLTYNTPEYLQERHGFSRELMQNISAVETLAAKLSE